MFDAITYLYESETHSYSKPPDMAPKPYQLYITISGATVSKSEGKIGGYKELSIRGLRNPFPFTKIVVEEANYNLNQWLYDTPYKYKKVGTVRHRK